MFFSITAGIDFSAVADSNTESFESYKFEYLTNQEAKAFIGFLLGKNNLDERLWQTDIFYYLTGQLSNDEQKECEARIAFAEIASELLNARIKYYEDQTNLASTNLITFLQNRYGVNMDAELVNPIINSELNSVKEIIKGFVAIATETELYELDAVEKIFDSVELITNRDKKIEEYTQCINAIFDLTKFTTSAQQLDMYKQFTLYISHARCYLNFGESEISNMIIELTQDVYDLTNERSKWSDCISQMVQFVDIFGLLDDYWLNWNTDERIALLKKWASFIAYTQKASEEYVVPVMTNYSMVKNSIIKEDGSEIIYSSRKYSIKTQLTYEIEANDLKYYFNGDQVVITDYIGYDGKYDYVSIPSEIDGKKVTQIEQRAFENCNFSSIIIPESMQSIGDYAFYGSISLDKVLILNDNLIIGNHVFDWKLGSSDQSVGDVQIYCNMNSTAYNFCQENEGFHYEPLKWDGKTIWGVASLNNKYRIHCGAELAYMAQLVNSGMNLDGFTISIEANIDLGNYDWYPIGTQSKPYRGSLDGNNNTITSIKIFSGSSDGGIFGYVESDNSFFSDLNLASGNIKSSSNLGGLIGTLIISANSNIIISNITSDLDDQGIGSLNRGGIIGLIKGGKNSKINIRDCKNYGILKAYEFSGNVYVGGIVGQSIMEDDSVISFYRCSNKGKLSTSLRGAYSASFAGGLLGKGDKGNYIFQECAVGGEVYSMANGSIASSGGIVSVLAPKSIRIENCEVFAYIYGSQCQNAGFISALDFTNIEANSSYIKNSYISSVIQGGEIGAFIRGTSSLSKYDILIENTYFDSGKTSTNKLVYSTFRNGLFYSTETLPMGSWCNNSGKKDSQTLKSNRELYNCWDFDSVWKYDSSGYPILMCFEDIVPCSEHDYSTVVTNPTCTAKGYTTYTCLNCNYSYVDNYLDSLGHDYSNYVKTVIPTCTSNGYDVYKCVKCNATENRNIINANGHSYGTHEIYSLPTCNSKGSTVYICSVCDYNNIVEDVENLDGTALTSALDTAKTKLSKVCYSESTYNTLNQAYELHKDGCDTYTSQEVVDTATTELLEAIDNLEIIEEYSGTGKNGEIWTWRKSDECLTISGNGEMGNYTRYSVPWTDFKSLIKKVIIEDGITKIGDYSFYQTPNLVHVDISDDVKSIGKYAFCNCANLVECELPSQLESLGDLAFASSRKLQHVALPSTVKSFGVNAYSYNDGLKRLDITDFEAYLSIDMGVGSNPLYYAKNIYLNGELLTDIVIPRSVTKIGNEMFSGCQCLRSIRLHDNITSIGSEAFRENINLISIDIPDSVDSIGKNAFYCSGLETVYLGVGINSIAQGAFYNCTNLTDVYFGGSEDEWNSISIADKNESLKNATIHYNYKPKCIHSYDILSAIPATTDTNEIITYQCILCGDQYVEESYLDLADFKFKTVSLSLASSITMNFKVLKTAVADFENPYVQFTRNGNMVTVSDYTEQGDYLVFSYNDIAPQAMNDTVTAVLKAEHNSIRYSSKPLEYSVSKYAYAMLDKCSADQYAKLRTLLVDLLNYGAEAQNYQNYKTDDLVNSKLTDFQKAWASTDELNLKDVTNKNYSTVENPIAEWKSASLQLNDSVAVRYKFTAQSVDNLSVKVTCGISQWEYNNEKIINNGDGTYSLLFSDLNADKMSQDIFITIMNGDTAVSNTMRFSVESYSKKVQDLMPNSSLQKLTDAMMRYGKAAASYA